MNQVQKDGKGNFSTDNINCRCDLTSQRVWLCLTMFNCLDYVQLESAGSTTHYRKPQHFNCGLENSIAILSKL